ncbi:DUF2471 family protein [Burkholderia diffusa]|uniref:DUF2471 family protein n=1 Tax=Burkholderia diffusa TaxID=488732 RepID=UPI000ADDA8EC|nr:DUF2471 family protein [Burkholderia diffusa]
MQLAGHYCSRSKSRRFPIWLFQNRNDPPIVAVLPRIGPATMPGVDFSGLIDWSHTDPSLPMVYRCVRELLVGVSTTADGRDAA